MVVDEASPLTRSSYHAREAAGCAHGEQQRRPARVGEALGLPSPRQQHCQRNCQHGQDQRIVGGKIGRFLRQRDGGSEQVAPRQPALRPVRQLAILTCMDSRFTAQGVMDLDSKTPMRTDAVFRIISMTKPIIATSILMLAEEGKLRPNVSHRLPLADYAKAMRLLVERKAILQRILPHNLGPLRYSEHIEKHGYWFCRNGWRNWEWTADSAYADLWPGWPLEEARTPGSIAGPGFPSLQRRLHRLRYPA